MTEAAQLDYSTFEALTFDCYGTLIDWNGGIRRELSRLFGAPAADGLLDRGAKEEEEDLLRRRLRRLGKRQRTLQHGDRPAQIAARPGR